MRRNVKGETREAFVCGAGISSTYCKVTCILLLVSSYYENEKDKILKVVT
jgi:hypothetical protein